MAYFAALLTRSAEGWEASDIDLDDVADLDGLADLMRSATVEDQVSLLFMEQEDMWFGVVRVDGEDDARVFVSDTRAAVRSAYGEILLGQLLAAGDAGVEELLELAEPDEDQLVDEDEEEEPTSVLVGPTGDADLLADLGLAPDQLLDLAGREGMLPTEALAVIAELAGCAEALESVR
ncbi:MAG TPA: tRNA adenosine deaminase-associated protein [Actinomycetes bacterium]|nr:tRNA adenosine deaminase-associated protein [Actinomycetes bacterium]